jgi:hypothetical protein
MQYTSCMHYSAGVRGGVGAYNANLSRYYQATIYKPIYIDTSENQQRDCYNLLQLIA